MLSSFHFERGCPETVSCIDVLEEQSSQSQTTRLFLFGHHPVQLVLSGLGCSVGMEDAFATHLNFQVSLLMSVMPGFLPPGCNGHCLHLSCASLLGHPQELLLLPNMHVQLLCECLTPPSNVLHPETGYSHRIASAEACTNPEFKTELGLKLYTLHGEEITQKVKRNSSGPVYTCASTHTHTHTLTLTHT